jgi:hypothetical protein
MASSKIRLYGATSGFVELEAPAVAFDGTIVLPNDPSAIATEDFVDAAVAAIPAIAGIGSNVVTVIRTTDSAHSVASGGAADATGLSATITPSSSSSKILVLWSITGSTGNQSGISARCVRGSTNVGVGTNAGRTPIGSGMAPSTATAENSFGTASQVFLDSPGVATPVTYKLQVVNNLSTTQTILVNRNNNTLAYNPTAASSLTLIEVAA